MDHEDYVRMCGEQALLQKERDELRAAFIREKEGWLSFYNKFNLGMAPPGWLDGETGRLRRLHDMQERLAGMDSQIAALKKVTGI